MVTILNQINPILMFISLWSIFILLPHRRLGHLYATSFVREPLEVISLQICTLKVVGV
jgi:hypothetical protein